MSTLCINTVAYLLWVLNGIISDSHFYILVLNVEVFSKNYMQGILNYLHYYLGFNQSNNLLSAIMSRLQIIYNWEWPVQFLVVANANISIILAQGKHLTSWKIFPDYIKLHESFLTLIMLKFQQLRVNWHSDLSTEFSIVWVETWRLMIV